MKTDKPKQSLLLHEVLEHVQECKTRAERIEFLKEHDTYALRTLLQLAFNKTIKLSFPKGAPPYTPSEAPAGHEPARLKNTFKSLGTCVKGNGVQIYKKEKIFIGILEAINNNDAKALIAAKDKELQKLYSKVTLSLIEKTFPALVK